MNAKGASFFIVFFLVLFAQTYLYGQKASAEFISSFPPSKLPSGEQVKDGIQNLFFKDNLLYVSNIWAGMQILDVSDVNNPKELGTYRADRNHNIFVEDTRAYLSNELNGIDVVDVSNPANPFKITNIRTIGDAYWVVARYPYVFVAEETQGVNVYDISDPVNPKRVGGYDTPGWAWGLDIAGDYLYVADKNGGLIVLDISDVSNVKKVGQAKEFSHAKTVQVEGNYAYVANGPHGICIIDVSNPAFPKCAGKFEIKGFAYNARKSGKTIFVANETKKMVQFVELTDKMELIDGGHYTVDSNVYDALKKDVYVYVAADVATLILRHNHPPTVVAITNKTINEADTLIITAEGYDPDGDPIYYTVKNLPEGAQFDSLSGQIVWTPTFEQSGLYPKITISAVENTASGLTASTTFDITVNHVNRNPLIPDIPDTVIAENTTLKFIVPEGSDPDVEDKGRLTYQAENMPEGAQFAPKTRLFSWTPTYEQSGTYVVDFSIHDGAGGVMRDASTITVTHVDRPPVLEPIAAQTVNENERLVIYVKGADPDKEDQNAISFIAENLPEGATFNPDSALFSWTPTYEQSGEYKNIVFVMKAGNLSDTVSVDITVIHVPRPPVLTEINDQTVDETNPLTFTISGSDPDKEDEGKIVFSAENLPEGAKFIADSLKFSWTPTYEQAGVYPNIVFKVKDAAGLETARSITITVNNVNRPPQLAELEPKTVKENMPLTFQLVGSDPDKENEGKLTYSAEGLPEGATLDATTGTFYWTPTFEQSGEYPMKFTVSDGELSDTKETTVTVEHVNRVPVITDIAPQTVNENEELTVKIEASDPDKEDEGKTTVAVSGLPEGAVFDASSNTITWKPTYEQSGTYSDIKVKASDEAGLSSEKIITITVNHVNRPPQIQEVSAVTVKENEPVSFNLQSSDPDKEDEGKLKYSASNLPKGANLDASSGAFSWTPAYDQAGNYTITFKVSDGEAEATTNVQITVENVNRPPTIKGPVSETVTAGESVSLSYSGDDPDGDNLTFSADGLPAGASLSGSGHFGWTPGDKQTGSHTFTVKVSDGKEEASISTTITVNEKPRPEPEPAPTDTTGQ